MPTSGPLSPAISAGTATRWFFPTRSSVAWRHTCFPDWREAVLHCVSARTPSSSMKQTWNRYVGCPAEVRAPSCASRRSHCNVSKAGGRNWNTPREQLAEQKYANICACAYRFCSGLYPTRALARRVARALWQESLQTQEQRVDLRPRFKVKGVTFTINRLLVTKLLPLV